MLLHYDRIANKLTRCYVISIDDDTLFLKLYALDKTLELYNKSLQEVSNKIWYSQNCSSFAFYEPYIYSCVRIRCNKQINIYLCLNIKVCNKCITIMCAPPVEGESIAYGLYLNDIPSFAGLTPKDEASIIVQKYIDNYCRTEELKQLSVDEHYNPWNNKIFLGGSVNLDGDNYQINSGETIILCKPSENYVFNHVYTEKYHIYALPSKVALYEQQIPTNHIRTEIINYMDKLENEGLVIKELPNDSILNELT